MRCRRLFSAFQAAGEEYDSVMRVLAFALLISAAPLPAQTPLVVQQVAGAPAPATWNPAAPYITAGQDEPGYRQWYLADPSRAVQVKAFNDYLAGAQVAG